MTAISSRPMREVLVPGTVNTPGLGASTRRTSGVTSAATPGTRSATEHLRCVADHSEAARNGVDEVGAAMEVGDGLERLDRREDHLQLAVALALERVGRPHPQVGDRLAIVVERLLLRRRGGHEEAGVVAARRAPRR